MTEAADEVARVMRRMGRTVRESRRRLGLSLEGLAGASGVSRRVISQLESGGSNPSLSTIDRIAKALGTDFSRLMLPSPGDSLSITGLGESAAAWTSPLGSTARLLQSSPERPAAELWDWVIAPGDVYVAEPDPAGSTELFTVLEGTLTIDVEDEPLRDVAAGQSARLASDRNYSYRNDASTRTHFIRVVRLSTE